MREVLSTRAIEGRRSGAVLVVNDANRLIGIFTDSDLARLFESRRETALDRPIGEVMTAQPILVPAGSMLCDAMSIMAERKLSELPVVDADGKPIGLLDITDVVSDQPPETMTDDRSTSLASLGGPRLLRQSNESKWGSDASHTSDRPSSS